MKCRCERCTCMRRCTALLTVSYVQVLCDLDEKLDRRWKLYVPWKTSRKGKYLKCTLKYSHALLDGRDATQTGTVDSVQPWLLGHQPMQHVIALSDTG